VRGRAERWRVEAVNSDQKVSLLKSVWGRSRRLSQEGASFKNQGGFKEGMKAKSRGEGELDNRGIVSGRGSTRGLRDQESLGNSDWRMRAGRDK